MNNPSTTLANRTAHHHMDTLCDVNDLIKSGEIALVKERIAVATELHSRSQDAMKTVSVYLAMQKELTATISMLRLFYDRVTKDLSHLENGIVIAKKVLRPAVSNVKQ